jgi:hypothetical protein
MASRCLCVFVFHSPFYPVNDEGLNDGVQSSLLLVVSLFLGCGRTCARIETRYINSMLRQK